MKKFTFLLIFFTFLAGFVWGQSNYYYWTGDIGDNFWQESGNWKDEDGDPVSSYPGENPSDIAIIDINATIRFSSDPIDHLSDIRFESDVTLNVPSGGLTVNNGITVNGDVTISSGILNVTNGITVYAGCTLNLSGAIHVNTGSVTVLGTMEISDSVTIQTSTDQEYASFKLSGNNNQIIASNVVFGSGIVSDSAYNLTFNVSGNITINGDIGENSSALGNLVISNGTMQLGANNIYAASVVNNGTITLNGSGSQTVSSGVITGTGLVHFNAAGTGFANITQFTNLRISAGIRIAPAALTVSGTWIVDAPGIFAHNSGTVTFNNGATVNSDSIFNNVICNGNVNFTGNNVFSSLTVSDNAVASFADDSEQEITAGLTTGDDSVLTAIAKAARWRLITTPAINFSNVDASTTISWCESSRFLGWFEGYTAINGNNNIDIFYESGTFIWTGLNGSGAKGLWSNNGNWLPASPGSNASAIIIIPQTVNHPVLDVNVECKSLTIESGAVLDLKGFDLSVATTITNNGEIELFGILNQVTFLSLLSGTASAIRYYNDTPGETAYWVFGRTYANLIISGSVIMAADSNMDLIVNGSAELGSALNVKSAEVTGAVTATNINITAAEDIKLEGNNRAVNVNLEGNGEISFHNILWAGVTLSVTNHSATGVTNIIAAGKLIVNGITGGVVTLEADEIEVNSEINCHSLAMKILSLEKAAIKANLIVASGTIPITANGNLNVDTGNIIINHALNLTGSGNIIYNSLSAADETVSVTNNASAGGTVTLQAAGKLFVNGIANGGTVSVTAGNIDITSAVTGGVVTLSAENINITASINCDRLAMYASHTSGAVTIGAVITSGGSGDCGETAAVYIMTQDFAGIGSINLAGTGDVCVHQYDSPTYMGTVTGNRIHYHYHIPDNTHIVYRAGLSPVDGGAPLPGSISGQYRYLKADDPLGANIAYSTYGSGNVYIIDIEDGINTLANSRNLSFTTGISGVIELIGDYFSSGSLNFYPGPGGDGVKISSDNITLGGAFEVHGKITLDNDDIKIIASKVILNEIIEGKNSLTINGPTTLLGGVSGIGELILNDKLTLGSNVVINADYTELDEVNGSNHSLTINALPVSGHAELKNNINAIANLEINGNVVLGGNVIINAAATVKFGSVDANDKSLVINGNIINDAINITDGIDIKLTGNNTAEAVTLEGNGEISYNSQRPAGVTVSITNNDIAAGETTVTAFGILTVNSITGGIVSLSAGNISVDGGINSLSLALNAAGSIVVNDLIESGSISFTAADTVTINSGITTTSAVACGVNAAVYIQAGTFEGSADITLDDPAETGAVCVNASQAVKYSGFVTGDRMHYHLPNKHIVYAVKSTNMSSHPDITDYIYFEADSIRGNLNFTAASGRNIYVINIPDSSANETNTRDAVFATAAGGAVEIRGAYYSSGAFDLTGAALIRLNNAVISLLDDFGPYGANINVIGTSSALTAHNIILDSPVSVTGALVLHSRDNIDISGVVSGTGSLTLNADAVINVSADISANAGVTFNNDVVSHDGVDITASGGFIVINNNFTLNGTTTFASEVRLGSGDIEFTGNSGAGDKVVFSAVTGASSAIKITDADVEFKGNVSVNSVSVENASANSVNTLINADITTANSQSYKGAVDMIGNPILTSLNGDIEFTKADTPDVIDSAGSIIKLVSGNDIVINIPIVNAVQLILSAQNGKVSIDEARTTSNGVESEAASIYIFTSNFEVTTMAADSIIPGTAGQLCLLLNNPVGWADTYDVVEGARWHQHIPIVPPPGMHLVIFNSSVTNTNDLELVFNPALYHYQDSLALNGGDLLTVNLGNNIYIYNVSNDDDSAPMLNLIVPGGGYIEFYGKYESSGINLHAGTGGVRLKDADITITGTGSFNTNGAGLVLDETENKISAGAITLNGGILGTVTTAALTLNTAGNILMTGDIGTSAARLGDIVIEDGNVSFNTANPVYVKSYTQEPAASLDNTTALEINAAENAEFKGAVNVTNAFVITGNAVFADVVNADSLHVTEYAGFESAAVITNALVVEGNAVFNAGVSAGSLQVTQNAEFKSAANVTNALAVTGKAIFAANINAGSLQVTGASEIGAASAVTITTTQAAGQIYTGDITLAGNVQFVSGTQGDVELGLIHGGNRNLTISAKSAVMNGTYTGSDIGVLNITPLDNVSFNSSQLNASAITVNGNSEINADIHTTGAQNFNGDVNFGSVQHTLTSTGGAITVPITGKVSGTAGAVINASLGISMTNPANDLSGSVSLNNNQGTANGNVNFITTGTISITGENVGRQFNIRALKIDTGFIKAANLTVNSVLGILLNGDNEITSAVTLNNNTGDPATDSGNVLFNNVSTGSLTLTTSNNIGNIHITAAGIINTSGPIDAPNGEIELVSSANININSSINAVQLKILAAGNTVTIAGAAGINTESPGAHGHNASIYIDAGNLVLPASSMNIIPGLSGKICVTVDFVSNGRVDPDRICDHGIGVVPHNINIVYGHNPPSNIYTNDLYHIINSSDNIGVTVTFTVDPGYHIIIIDTNNNYYAVNRTVAFVTSGTSSDDYIKFLGDQTYHQTTGSALTLDGNVIIEGNVNISNAYVIQLENTSLTIKENASLKLVNEGSWLIGNGAVEPDSFTGIYGSLIMNNASTLTAKRFILDGDSDNERFVVNKSGAQRAALELTGHVNIGDYVDYTGNYSSLYMQMAGSGTQDITAWNFIGSLQIEQSSNTVLLSNLEIHGEVIINNPGSLDAGNHNVVLRAGLTDTARYGASAKVGRWRIENGSINTPAFLQNSGASVTLKKINSSDTVFFEIIGNTVWQNFICLNEIGATIRFSAYPDRHKFMEEFSIMADNSANPADRITVTRYTTNADWLYAYDNTSIIPPANGLPTEYEASQYNRFWNLEVDNVNNVKLKHIRLFFSHTEKTVIIDPVIDSIEAFPFYTAGAKSYFNHNWREDKAFVVYSFLEDANGNGKADRIRAQTSSVLDKNINGFNGFDVTVTGYTIKHFEFAEDADDDSFYIVLNEDTQHSLYNGDRVTWQIKTNTTLKDKKGRLFGAQSADTYSSIPPRISYALTLPNHPQTVIQMSQSVGANGLSAANINSQPFSGFKSSYSITSGEFSVEELANNPLIGDDPVTDAYFIMEGFWSSEDKVDVDPDYLPKYPLNWNYSAYSNDESQTFVSPYRVLTPEMMKKLAEWNTNKIPSNLVTPDDFENGGDLIKRRSTDILVSRSPADANDENYFALPVLARSAGQNITDDNTRVIYNFDGTDFLGGSAAIDIQTKILNEGIKDNLSVYWSVNVPLEYRNPKEMPSRGNSGGLWMPDITTGGKTPLYYYSPALDKNVNAASSDSASLLFIHNLAVNPPFVSGNKVEFVYRLREDSDMIAARLDIPRGTTSIPADWYNRIRPFSFDIQDIRQQRGGVTIMNNVINPATGESTYIRYVLARPGRVTIQVHTLDGSLVKSIRRNEHRDAGEYTEAWDGTNTGGRPLARGIYFIRIVGPDIDEIRKVMVVR